MKYANLEILDHPLARHYLTLLRDESTKPNEFRAACKRLTMLLAMEAARENLSSREVAVTTPIETAAGSMIAGPQIAVAILRAGLGMLDPVVDLFPEVRVGYLGMERDEITAEAASYYAKLPPQIECSPAFLLDPMLATGGSASRACDLLKAHGASRIVMLSVVVAPEGVEHMLRQHPDVTIYAAALDRGLNEKKYIVPGLGDFGDRLYGT